MTDHIIIDGQPIQLTAQRYLIGRGEGCEILLPENDPAVSRRHAMLERGRDGNWSIVDLGSRNGTTINGVRVADRQDLRDGDGIAIGGSKIVLSARRAAPTVAIEAPVFPQSPQPPAAAGTVGLAITAAPAPSTSPAAATGEPMVPPMVVVQAPAAPVSVSSEVIEQPLLAPSPEPIALMLPPTPEPIATELRTSPEPIAPTVSSNTPIGSPPRTVEIPKPKPAAQDPAQPWSSGIASVVDTPSQASAASVLRTPPPVDIGFSYAAASRDTDLRESAPVASSQEPHAAASHQVGYMHPAYVHPGACHACRSAIAPGSRWCGVCHTHALNPAFGKLASPGKRLGAYFIDSVVPIFLFINFVIGLGGIGAASQGSGVGFGLFGAVIMFALVAFQIWSLVLFVNGSTPGKKALGMHVIKEDGSRARFWTMLLREWIGKYLSALVFSIGFLWILFDKERQGWHDKLMSTFVVDSRTAN